MSNCNKPHCSKCCPDAWIDEMPGWLMLLIVAVILYIASYVFVFALLAAVAYGIFYVVRKIRNRKKETTLN